MKANELIKKDTGIDRQVLTNRKRPVVHSDRGAHYRWPGWLSRVEEAKLIRSMSRKGCSPDNAACEGFFGRLKTELFYPRNWQSTSIKQFIQALDSYIRWYNEKRIKISLGALSPVEYRESLGLTGITSPSFLPHLHWVSLRSAATSLEGSQVCKVQAPASSCPLVSCFRSGSDARN